MPNSNNAAFYARLASTADKLLKKFGAPASIQRIGPSTYDPDQSSSEPLPPAAENIFACVFDYDERVIDGSLIQRGDKQAFVSAINLKEPSTTDKFIWNGETYTIIKHKELAPAGSPNVLFEWQVRK